MKTKLLIAFLGLTLGLLGAPLWAEKGSAETRGLTREAYRDTTSMRPALVGDGYFYYQFSQDVKVGDWVVLIRASDGKKVLHVVTAANKRAVYTSGLNCRYSDGWSPRSQVIGVVRYIERKPVSHLAQAR